MRDTTWSAVGRFKLMQVAGFGPVYLLTEVVPEVRLSSSLSIHAKSSSLPKTATRKFRSPVA